MSRKAVLILAFVVLAGLIEVERAFALRRVGVSPGNWARALFIRNINPHNFEY